MQINNSIVKLNSIDNKQQRLQLTYNRVSKNKNSIAYIRFIEKNPDFVPMIKYAPHGIIGKDTHNEKRSYTNCWKIN